MIFRPKHIIAAILTVSAVSGFSQVRMYVPDSMIIVEPLNEIVVTTGARPAANTRDLAQSVSVIYRGRLEQTMQPTILPAVTEQVPGVFATSRGIMGYGVSAGAAGGISIRGLSGGSARMMVLIDGHPQYAGIFGHPIADAYQTMLAERIEVVRGPASTLYGSNAMGGVINIITRKVYRQGVHTNLHLGYGSYNTLETEFANSIIKDRFASLITGSYNRTDGHRDNMPFEQYGGYGKFTYYISNNWQANADINVTQFNASNPGPESAPLLDNDQRITRGMTSFALRNYYKYTDGSATFFYNWGRHRINDGYTPSTGGTPQDGRFNSSDNMMGASLYQRLDFTPGTKITAGFDWFRYGGKAWTKYVQGEREGTRVEMVDKHTDEVAGYIDVRQDIFRRHLTLNAGIRIDHHSTIGTEWIPQAGVAVHLQPDIEIKASATKGFRYPTIREMYMFPPQNPNLKPESMWNYEIAFAQNIGYNTSYGINLFYIDGDNLIMTLPNPAGGGMLNQNSGKINNFGIELQTRHFFNADWTLDANYSYLHMDNPVIAAPQHKLYAEITYRPKKWSVSSGIQYIAGLYTAIGDNPQTEDFVLWNIRASFRATDWLSLWVKGENLLAQKYEINAGYPMPRATAMGGINIKF